MLPANGQRSYIFGARRGTRPFTGMQREYDGEQIIAGRVRVLHVRQIDLKPHLSLEHGRTAGSPPVLDPERQRASDRVTQLGYL